MRWPWQWFRSVNARLDLLTETIELLVETLKDDAALATKARELRLKHEALQAALANAPKP